MQAAAALKSSLAQQRRRYESLQKEVTDSAESSREQKLDAVTRMMLMHSPDRHTMSPTELQ